MLYVTKVEYLYGLSLRITFNDGCVRDIDFTSFFKKNSHPQFNKYCEPKKFKKFVIDHGNVVWGKNWDLMFPIEDLRFGEI